MHIGDHLTVLLLGYAGLDPAAKQTWLLLRMLTELVPITSRNLDLVSDISGCHVATIRRHVKALYEAGLLRKRRTEGPQGLVQYTVLDPVETDGTFVDIQKGFGRLEKRVSTCVHDKSQTPSPLSKRGGRGSDPDIRTSANRQTVQDWTSDDFLALSRRLYRKTYGHPSLDLEPDAHGKNHRGKLLVRLKRDLINRFRRVGLGKEAAADYLHWLFQAKSGELDINAGIICSRSLQSEYMTARSKKDKELVGKKRVSAKEATIPCPKAKAAGVDDVEAWRFYEDGDRTCLVCMRKIRCSERKALECPSD